MSVLTVFLEYYGLISYFHGKDQALNALTAISARVICISHYLCIYRRQY